MNRPMMGALLIAIAAIFSSVPSAATANGYGYATANDGYAYRNGYWWRNGVAYTRYTDKCWYNCNRSWYWCYRYAVAEPQPTTAAYATSDYTVSSADENWRTKLLSIAESRDKYEAGMRRSALEHNEFVESVRLMGFTGNFAMNGYGQSVNYAQGLGYGGMSPYGQQLLQQQGYSQQTTPQGATTYGYSQSADLYGNTDLGQIYNQALRLRDQSRQMEAQGSTETTALVDNLGGRAAAIAEIQAKAAAMQQLIAAAGQASNASPSASITNRVTTQTVGPVGQSTTTHTTQNVDPTGTGPNFNGNAPLALVQATLNTHCVVCHSPAVKKGNLDLSDLSRLDRAAGMAVLERITTRDPNRLMPRNQDNSPGQPLSDVQVMQFFNAVIPQ